MPNRKRSSAKRAARTAARPAAKKTASRKVRSTGRRGAPVSDERALLAAARDARDHAVAPFSRFKVGAAIRSRDGRIFTGCNIENASFGLTLCAERVAIFKALSEGVREFDHVAIVTAAGTPTPPCGACRQILWEFAPGSSVTLANLRGRKKRMRLASLFPAPFDASDLNK